MATRWRASSLRRWLRLLPARRSRWSMRSATAIAFAMVRTASANTSCGAPRPGSWAAWGHFWGVRADDRVRYEPRAARRAAAPQPVLRRDAALRAEGLHGLQPHALSDPLRHLRGRE